MANAFTGHVSISWQERKKERTMPLGASLEKVQPASATGICLSGLQVMGDGPHRVNQLS